MKKAYWALVVVLALVLAAPALAAQGKGQGKSGEKGKGKPAESGTTAEPAEKEKQKEKEKDKAKKEKEEKEREEQAAQGRAIGKDQEAAIRVWFSNPENRKGLPPGLAKREKLPPGLQKHLERNGTLPPGLQKKIQPMPASLEAKLPKPPEGVKRVVVAGNVILLEERTSKILDIVKDVVSLTRKSKGSEESTTGVRRTD